MFHYELEDPIKMTVSENGTLVYLIGFDTKLEKNVILMFKAGVPAVQSFYRTFLMGLKESDSLISVIGHRGDYVTVTRRNSIFMFRMYESPMIMFENVTSEHKFNVTFTNDPEGRYSYIFEGKV